MHNSPFRHTRGLASGVPKATMKQCVTAFALSVAVLLGQPGCGAEPPLEVAQDVDLSRFQGKWYEIARLPRTTQTDCHGTTAFYTQNPGGTLSLVNQCNVGGPSGPLSTVSMIATVPNGAEPAKLALSVGGFSGDYWILEVGASYEYAVVGHPSREYLWILSRTPTLDAPTMQGVIARAQGQHFDMTRLEYTPQPPAGERNDLATPVGSVPPAVTTGCSVSQAPARTAPLGTLGWMLGLWAYRSRRSRGRAR
jgi:apolipoprotein D and lipocalin family protein